MRTAAHQLAKPLIALSALLFEASNNSDLHAQRLPPAPNPVVKPLNVFSPQDYGTQFASQGKAQAVQQELKNKAARKEEIVPEDVERLFAAFQAEPQSRPTGDFIRQYIKQFADSPVAIRSIVRFLANTETITATYKTFGKYLACDDPETVFYTLMAFAKNNYGPERIELGVQELTPLLQHSDADISSAAFLMAHTRQLPVMPGSILQLVRAQRWLGDKDRQGGDEVRLGQLLNAMLDNSISPPDLSSPLLRTLSSLDALCPGYFDTLAARPEALELFARELLKEISAAREKVLAEELVNQNTRTLVTFHEDRTLFREGDLRGFFERVGVTPTFIRYGVAETVGNGNASTRPQSFKARVLDFLRTGSSDPTRKHLWFSGNHGAPGGLYYSRGEAQSVLQAGSGRKALPHFAVSDSELVEALLDGQKDKKEVQLSHCVLILPNCFSGDFCFNVQEELIRCADERGQTIQSFPWILAGAQPGMLVDYTPHLRDITFRDKGTGEEVKINIPQLEVGAECVRELRFASRSCEVRIAGSSISSTGTNMNLAIAKPDDIELKNFPTQPQPSSRLELGLLNRLGVDGVKCLTVGDLCEVQSELGTRLWSELGSDRVRQKLTEAQKSSAATKSFYIAPVHETDPLLHTPYPLQSEAVLQRVIERCQEQDSGFPKPEKLNAPKGRARYIFEIGLAIRSDEVSG